MIEVAFPAIGLICSTLLAVHSCKEDSAPWFGFWLAIGLVNLANLIIALGRLG